MAETKLYIFKCAPLLACLLFLFSPQTYAQEWVYTVVKGDTLSEFSQKHLYKTSYWKQLQKINNVIDPKRIPENTKLRVPIAWIKSQPASATIIKITGSAHIYRQGTPRSTPAAIDNTLNLGDQLETGEQSNVLIRFADNSEIVVMQNAKVDFNHMTQYGETGMVDSRIRLIQGDIETHAKTQKGNAARFEIHTPAAISAVRGTRFRTSYSTADSSSHIEVLEGGVAVKGGRTTRLVRSGYGTHIEKNKAPLKPQKLLPAPKILTYPEPIEVIGSQVRWKPIKKAINYRVLISTSQQFGSIVWDSNSDRTAISLPDLADATYFFELRAIDKFGIEGIPTHQSFTLNAHPQPPFLAAPNDQAIIRGEPPTLEWTRSSEADKYRLEISLSKSFQTTVTDRNTLTETTYRASELSPSNTYYWRVASIAKDGEQGPYSPIRMITMKPIPAVPQPALEESESDVKLTWLEGLANETFQIQIARDRQFDSIISDTNSTKPELTLPRPEGYRYIRVRTLADDGFAGAWGVTQELSPPPNESWIYIYGSFLMTVLLL